MSVSQSAAAQPLPTIVRYTGLMDWLTTVDHKKIGLMYFWFVVVMGLVGGAFAGAIRFQLALPGATLESIQAAYAGSIDAIPLNLLSQERHLYNQILTMHASVMIFFTIIPGFIAFANYVVPLMIGARDMAFPKMNALGFWLLIPSAILMMASFFVEGGAAASGWTAYPPLSVSSSPGPGQDMWVMGVHLAGVSSVLAAVNFMVTIISLRAPGVTWSKLPLFAWATFFVSIIQLVATPVLAAAVTMVLMDRNFGTTFTIASKGGDPVLYQHIFWFYSHPAVYIMILPGFGAISHIFSAFSRKMVFGYWGMVWATGSIAFLGFIVWAHHMFTVGMPTELQLYFTYMSLAIGVPTGIKVFSWIATMWGGTVRFTTSMKFACGFISLFVMGGFGGLILALVPIDKSLHDSYFVVGHFHMVLVGGSVMLLFAMTYYWWPKFTGRMLSERTGFWVFWLMFLGTLITFFAMHLSGANGMARRVPVLYGDFKISNHLTTFGYCLTFISALLFFIDLLLSHRRKPHGKDDPWEVNDVQQSFEWATGGSPPPVYNFAKVPPIPVVDPAPKDH